MVNLVIGNATYSYLCTYILTYIYIWVFVSAYIYIYIYIYIYVVFNPVKPESGIIPSGQKSFNYEHLNFPGKELNVTNITEQ